MVVTALGPDWFLEADVLFDVFFLLTTALVTTMGWRAYKFFDEERYKTFTTGFFFITGSYLLLTLSNLFIMLELREADYSLREVVSLINLTTMGFFLYAVLFLIGLVYLLILYMKVEQRAVKLLLFALVIFSVLLSHQVKSVFFVLTAMLLLFILVQLGANYRAKRKRNALLVLIGFAAVFVGEVLLVALFLTPMLYAIAGGLTLFGYLCILGTLVIR